MASIDARKKSTTGVVRKSTKPTESSNEHFVPEARLIAALVNEVARGRARHRALLELLERSGVVDMSSYVEEYRREEVRDFAPFVDLLLLRKSEFEEKHPDWIKENLVRFGYDGSSRPQLSLKSTRNRGDGEANVVAEPKGSSRTRRPKAKT